MSLSLFRFSQRLLCESEVVGKDCILFGKLVFWVDLVHFFRSLESALRVEPIQALKVKLVISAACYSFKLKNKTKQRNWWVLICLFPVSFLWNQTSLISHQVPTERAWWSCNSRTTRFTFLKCVFWEVLTYSQNCATTPADWRTFWSPQNKSHIH